MRGAEVAALREVDLRAHVRLERHRQRREQR
jgi:hypothetical protein